MTTCKRCGATPESGARFRTMTFPDGKLVERRTCYECEKAARRRLRKEHRRDLEVGMIIPDAHHPNVADYAWNITLRAAAVVRPSIIVLMGDFLDGESLSLHEPDEPGKRDFEDELGCVLRALSQLDEIGAKRKVYVEGNHEQRLSRFLARRAPSLYRSLRLPELLKLEERGWEWVPYKQSLKIGKLHFTHDTGSAGMNAHRASAKAFMGNACIGHTHRMAYEVTGRFSDHPYLAAMFGWLGDAKGAARYLHEAKSAEWVHGFGVFYMEKSGAVHVQPVPIIDGKCVVQGRLIT